MLPPTPAPYGTNAMALIPNVVATCPCSSSLLSHSRLTEEEEGVQEATQEFSGALTPPHERLFFELELVLLLQAHRKGGLIGERAHTLPRRAPTHPTRHAQHASARAHVAHTHDQRGQLQLLDVVTSRLTR